MLKVDSKSSPESTFFSVHRDILQSRPCKFKTKKNGKNPLIFRSPVAGGVRLFDDDRDLSSGAVAGI